MKKCWYCTGVSYECTGNTLWCGNSQTSVVVGVPPPQSDIQDIPWFAFGYHKVARRWYLTWRRNTYWLSPRPCTHRRKTYER